MNSSIARELPMLNMEEAKIDYYQVLAGKRKFDYRIWRWLNLIRWSEIYNVTY